VKLIEEGRGTHFDPRLADILLDNLDEVLRIRAPNGRGPASAIGPVAVPQSGPTGDPG
jgi:HD-GYP domain-containing protein (c-di-GMP phosphodiesterase class II)